MPTHQLIYIDLQKEAQMTTDKITELAYSQQWDGLNVVSSPRSSSAVSISQGYFTRAAAAAAAQGRK